MIDFSNPERYIFLRNLEELKRVNAVILFHQVSEEKLQFHKSYSRDVEVKAIGNTGLFFRSEVIEEYSVYLVLVRVYRGNGQSFRDRPASEKTTSRT